MPISWGEEIAANTATLHPKSSIQTCRNTAQVQHVLGGFSWAGGSGISCMVLVTKIKLAHAMAPNGM